MNAGIENDQPSWDRTQSLHAPPDSLRHQCLIYEGAPSRQLESLARTLMGKLKANHRCIYLNSPPMIAGMRSRLAAAGLDLAEQTGRGALLLSSDVSHLVDGMFDVGRMLALLADEVQQSLSDGFAGLWATGDMTWEFGGERNLGKLLEYERRLEEFMRENTCLSGLCQYHRDMLPLYAVQSALETHPALYINATLSRLNPDYRFA